MGAGEKTMKIMSLILREIMHRKLNFALSLLAITVTVVLFISFFTTGEASQRETVRLMRNIGFNLRIITKGTDMEKFWLNGFSEYSMPQSYLYELASFENISYAHLTAVLCKKIVWRGKEIFLTGIAPEVSPPGKKKTPMAFSIDSGSVYLGYELARNFGLKKGDEINISGVPLIIARTLSESGSDDDIRIYGHLFDVQNILNMENQINEIKALQCLCFIDGINTSSLTGMREQLVKISPAAKVVMLQSIASAREIQRLMTEKYFGFLMPFITIVCLAWIGILAYMNVRERRREISILRALGYGSGKVAFLFLGKAIVIGLAGAVIGFSAGTVIASQYGSDIFKLTVSMINSAFHLLYWSLFAAPVVTATSFFIPAMLAVTQDPAVTLREE